MLCDNPERLRHRVACDDTGCRPAPGRLGRCQPDRPRKARPPHFQIDTPNRSQDCFDELENGTGTGITCLFPLRLSQNEQAELEKGSRGYVKNFACILTVRIPRQDVDVALAARNHIFQSPEQPMTCTVTTHKSSFDITATFAPRVVFKKRRGGRGDTRDLATTRA